MERLEIADLHPTVAEFDLTLHHPGKWMLGGYKMPWETWYTRQAHAISFASHHGQLESAILIRLHNRWLATDR